MTTIDQTVQEFMNVFFARKWQRLDQRWATLVVHRNYTLSYFMVCPTLFGPIRVVFILTKGRACSYRYCLLEMSTAANGASSLEPFGFSTQSVGNPSRSGSPNPAVRYNQFFFHHPSTPWRIFLPQAHNRILNSASASNALGSMGPSSDCNRSVITSITRLIV